MDRVAPLFYLSFVSKGNTKYFRFRKFVGRLFQRFESKFTTYIHKLISVTTYYCNSMSFTTKELNLHGIPQNSDF